MYFEWQFGDYFLQKRNVKKMLKINEIKNLFSIKIIINYSDLLMRLMTE